jgi:hypothetical protein
VKLSAIYIVRDPTPGSVLADILYETTIDRLWCYCGGSGPGSWSAEHTAVYTDGDEAYADAAERIHNRDRKGAA